MDPPLGMFKHRNHATEAMVYMLGDARAVLDDGLYVDSYNRVTLVHIRAGNLPINSHRHAQAGRHLRTDYDESINICYWDSTDDIEPL